MLIGEPRIDADGDGARLSARIEIADRSVAAPDTLWFRVGPEHRARLLARADPFLVAMLPIAQEIGEAIEIRGRASPRLAYGAREYQRVRKALWPRDVRIVDVSIGALEAPTEAERGHAVGCAFSGGVDSFYTLLCHLPGNEPIPEYRVTHAFMVNGFDHDVDLDDAGHFRALRRIYEPLFESLGIGLVVVATNLQAFRKVGTRRLGMIPSYASALAAAGLALGPLFARLYLASSYAYGQRSPEWSRAILDPLLSTEGAAIVHGGADATRAERVAAIAGWPETYARLRVCSNPGRRNVDLATATVDNCCRCDKCIRTMTTLDALGVLPRFEAFKLPLRRRDVRWTPHGSGESRLFARENLALARERGRGDLAFDLRFGLARDFVTRRAIGLGRRVSRFLRGR